MPQPLSFYSPIPAAWLDGNPVRVVCHWTAGPHQASADDRQHYHLLIEGTGRLVRGAHPISANDNTADGVYAAHTRGLNTQSIGVALCGMGEATERPFQSGPYPITAAQWAALARVLAQLADHYRLAIERRTILTHAEVQPILGIRQADKWDICVHPSTGALASPVVAGDAIRALADEVLSLRREAARRVADEAAKAAQQAAASPSAAGADIASEVAALKATVAKHAVALAALADLAAGVRAD